MSPKEWISVTESMTTLEITRGSLWQQPDDEYFDPSPAPLEKFLIKWTHASYLHVSWETEKDLLDMIGTSVKQQIKKFLIREAEGREIFEDLSKGEYFPASFLHVERILDVEDEDVRTNKVNWRKALLPSPSATLLADSPAPAANKEDDEQSENKVIQEDDDDEVAMDIDIVAEDEEEQPRRSKHLGKLTKKKRIHLDEDEEVAMNAVNSNSETVSPAAVETDVAHKPRPRKSKFLHGNDCWVMIKWEGLSYSEYSVEALNDIINAGIDYEIPLRAFYRREQSEPKVNATLRDLKVDHSIVGTTAIAPIFPAGELRDYQWEGVRWMLFNLMQGRNSILADEMGLGKVTIIL